LHNLGYTGEGLVIAVLDNGFQGVDTMEVFSRLYENGQILGTYDFVEIDDNPYNNGTHGTRVLSTMGGWWPGTLIGTAPDADYWLLKSEENGSEYLIEEDNWVRAAEFADSVGADIINSSLGYTRFDAEFQDHTYADMNGDNTRVTQGADIAASKGMLIVASAGNAGLGSWRYLVAPSDGDSVMAIGAVNFAFLPANFTSRGPSSDGRVKPNVSAKGVNVHVAVGDTIAKQGGTSFSGPLVAGAAASLWQAHPELKSFQIFEAIERSSTEYLNPDTLVGHGIPNFKIAYDLIQDFKDIPVERLEANPNPFQEELSINFFSRLDQELSLEVIDLLGKTLIRKEYQVYKGHNPLPLNVDGLPSGAYIISVSSFDEVHTKQLVRQR